MEQYFAAIPKLYGPTYQAFEKESWAFKHDRLAMDHRIENGGQVKTSDIGASAAFVSSNAPLQGLAQLTSWSSFNLRCCNTGSLNQ